MTIEITAELLEDLLAKAAAATPGPWQQCSGVDVLGEKGGFSAKGVQASKNDAWQIAVCSAGLTYISDYETATLSPSEHRHNAAYIAAANPDVVLALINEITTLSRALDEAIAQFDYSNDPAWRADFRDRMIKMAKAK